MIHLTHLPNQQQGETCTLFMRRHWIALVIIFGYSLLLLAIPIGIHLFLLSNELNILVHPLFGPVISVAMSVYLLCILLITITQFTDYYLDTWIITTERVISMEQLGLFSRVISELHLNQIQDVTSETHGLLATFLTYGDVYIQTAGTRERFNFKAIDNPEDVKRIILKLIDDDKRRHGDASQPGTLNDQKGSE